MYTLAHYEILTLERSPLTAERADTFSYPLVQDARGSPLFRQEALKFQHGTLTLQSECAAGVSSCMQGEYLLNSEGLGDNHFTSR